MPVTFNGTTLSPQPIEITEGWKQAIRDKVSAKLVVRRVYLAQKRQVALEFQYLTISQYNSIVGYFYGTGASLTYANSDSGTSFVGFATAGEGKFYKGASYLRDLTVTITER